MNDIDAHSVLEIPWRIEIELGSSGAYNMRRDEQLVDEVASTTERVGVLRLYSWSPWAISLGHTQSDRSIDREACTAGNIDIVRRPTGGRAVFHANELTYAVVCKAERGMSIAAMHNQITRAIAAGLSSLGDSRLELTSPTASTRESYKQSLPTNIACFASTARYELTFEGRKVMGSAQRRYGDLMLQHGSIPLDESHQLLPKYLQLDVSARVQLSQLLADQTASLSRVFARRITAEEAAEAIADQFADAMIESR